MSKILVVDDNPDILEAVQLILETQGYSVMTAEKSDEAVKSIQENKFDLIILDVLLSGGDGRTICKEIKQDLGKRVPVLMMSAHPSAEATIKNYGADAFIPKPFSVDKILKLVKTLLENYNDEIPEYMKYNRGKEYRN